MGIMYVLFFSGNITTCHTPQVISHAGFENRKKKELCEDMLTELKIQMDCWIAALPSTVVNGYIQQLQIKPFGMNFFTEKQVQLFVSECKGKDGCVMHFDSTGTIIKQIPGNKQPYLYSFIIGRLNMPVCEFVNTDQRTFSIANNLNFFLGEARRLNNGREVKPNVVVTDFSYANINSVLWSCNKTTLPVYLQSMYNELTKPLTRKENLTLLFLCSCHMIKAVSTRLVIFYWYLYNCNYHGRHVMEALDYHGFTQI